VVILENSRESHKKFYEIDEFLGNIKKFLEF